MHKRVKNVDLRSPLSRRAIKEQDRAWKRVMIYERDNDYKVHVFYHQKIKQLIKYVIEPYEKTGMANLSYWHQHITKTALCEESSPEVIYSYFCCITSPFYTDKIFIS